MSNLFFKTSKKTTSQQTCQIYAGFYVHFSLEGWKKQVHFVAKKLEKYVIFNENRLDFSIHTDGHPV